MYQLYYSPGSAALVVHQALLEIGAPFELVKLDTENREHKQAKYLAMNPNGTIPTLVIDGTSHYETAALLLALVERHPEAQLAPAVGDPTRTFWRGAAEWATISGCPRSERRDVPAERLSR